MSEEGRIYCSSKLEKGLGYSLACQVYLLRKDVVSKVKATRDFRSNCY